MLAIGFADTTHGFVFHKQCSASGCRAVVDATADGGLRWHRAGALPAPRPVVRLFVTSRQDAVASYSSRFAFPWRPGAFAYATTDGARHWHALALPRKSNVAAVAGGRVWAVRNLCRGRSVSHCTASVYASRLGARRFTLVSRPRTGGLAVTGLATAGTASVYLAAGAWYARSSEVLLSADGGRTWRVAANPCTTPQWSVSLSVPVASTRTVWALCAGQPAAGSEDKELAVSSDAGSSWTQRPKPNVGGYGTSLLTTAPTDAWWFGQDRADIYLTRDGGHTWRDVLRGRVGESAGAATYWFDPLSTYDAWVVTTGYLRHPSELLRTTDGGRTWHRLPLPFR